MERTNRTRPIWRVGVGVVVAALVIVVTWKVWPRKSLLLQHAVKVANMDGWDGAYRDYLWASDHEAMLYSSPEFLSDNQIHMVSHDTDTGIELPLTGLSERLNERQAKYNSYWLSPDGNWMLYSDYYQASVSSTPKDGSMRLTWHSKIWNSSRLTHQPTLAEYIGWNGIHWLPDSRRWIQPGSDSSGQETTHVVVRSIGSAGSSRSIAIPKSCRALFAGENSESMVWLSDTHLLLQTWTVEPGEESAAHSVDFYEADLKTDARPQHWVVQLPKEWTIVQVALSPHADHVAWVFHRQYVSPLLTQLRRFGLPIRLTPIEETMVNVSLVGGTDMREIGIAPSPTEANQDVKIKWLPGGKHLSFVYKNVLYTVSAF